MLPLGHQSQNAPYVCVSNKLQILRGRQVGCVNDPLYRTILVANKCGVRLCGQIMRFEFMLRFISRIKKPYYESLTPLFYISAHVVRTCSSLISPVKCPKPISSMHVANRAIYFRHKEPTDILLSVLCTCSCVLVFSNIPTPISHNQLPY